MAASRTREEALANPARTTADVKAALSGAGAAPPEVPAAPDDLVRLPGGLARDGKVHRTAVIRELTGADEEALSRAWASGSLFRFNDVLIERGTETVGDLPATRELLKSLLIGDRDELALAIRTATYGDKLAVERWQCPACGGLSDISFSLKDDVERTVLDDPGADGTFEVKLRRGATATVRLANGADQDAIFENENWTQAERNTRLLSRCVMSVTRADGQRSSVLAFPSLVLDMHVADRHELVRAITERQPGPRYNEVKFTHDECKNEVTLALGVRDLFRDLILFL